MNWDFEVYCTQETVSWRVCLDSKLVRFPSHMTPLFDATIVTQLNRFSDETIAAYDEKAWVRERESVWERRERVGKQLRESFESTLPRCYGSLVRLEIVSSNTHVCVCVRMWMSVWVCGCVYECACVLLACACVSECVRFLYFCLLQPSEQVVFKNFFWHFLTFLPF